MLAVFAQSYHMFEKAVNINPYAFVVTMVFAPVITFVLTIVFAVVYSCVKIMMLT
jgi:hypothetical protein